MLTLSESSSFWCLLLNCLKYFFTLVLFTSLLIFVNFVRNTLVERFCGLSLLYELEIWKIKENHKYTKIFLNHVSWKKLSLLTLSQARFFILLKLDVFVFENIMFFSWRTHCSNKLHSFIEKFIERFMYLKHNKQFINCKNWPIVPLLWYNLSIYFTYLNILRFNFWPQNTIKYFTCHFPCHHLWIEILL